MTLRRAGELSEKADRHATKTAYLATRAVGWFARRQADTAAKLAARKAEHARERCRRLREETQGWTLTESA